MLGLIHSLLVAVAPCELPPTSRDELMRQLADGLAVRTKLPPTACGELLSFFARLDDAGRMLDAESALGSALSAVLFRHLLESLVSDTQPGLATEQLDIAARIAQRNQSAHAPLFSAIKTELTYL